MLRAAAPVCSAATRSARCLSSPFTTTAAAAAPRVAIVDGVRTPFKTSGTEYNDLQVYDLSKMVMKSVLERNVLDGSEMDFVLWGNVIQEVKTSNVAREAALGAGIPRNIPAHTVTMACISSNAAISSGAEKILSGRADVVLCGGVETFSDVPIRFQRRLRQKLLKVPKAMKKGGPLGAVKHVLTDLRVSDLEPEAPAIKNFLTQEVMGNSSDRLAARFGVSRSDQDEFAVRSHVNAATAHAEGMLDQQILPFNGEKVDNGVRGDSQYDKLAGMNPAFIKPHGTHTAGNSSFLTDGAAATLIMSDTKAKELGAAPMAYLKDWTFQAVDPFEDLLLGPAFCIPKLLKDNGLTIEDIDVWEIHEAFAGQVLANMNAVASDKFAQESLGLDKAYGEIPMDKLNNWGGSLVRYPRRPWGRHRIWEQRPWCCVCVVFILCFVELSL
jgi:acetyl-CoA acyltransferase